MSRDPNEDGPLAIVPDPQYIQRLFPKCPPIVNKTKTRSQTSTTTNRGKNKRNKDTTSTTTTTTTNNKYTPKTNKNTINNNNNNNNNNNYNNNPNPDQNSSHKKTRKQHTRRQREAKRYMWKQQELQDSFVGANNLMNNGQQQQTNKFATTTTHTNLSSSNRLNNVKPKIDNNNTSNNLHKIANNTSGNCNINSAYNDDSSDEDGKLSINDGSNDGANSKQVTPNHRRFERHKANLRRRRSSSSNLLMPAIRETQLESALDTNNKSNNDNDNYIIALDTNDNDLMQPTDAIKQDETKQEPSQDTTHDVGDEELIGEMLASELSYKVDLIDNPVLEEQHQEQLDLKEAIDNGMLISSNDNDSRLSLVEVVQITTPDQVDADDKDELSSCGQKLVQNSINHEQAEQQHQQPQQQSTMLRQHKIPNETSHFSLINPNEPASLDDNQKSIIPQSNNLTVDTATEIADIDANSNLSFATGSNQIECLPIDLGPSNSQDNVIDDNGAPSKTGADTNVCIDNDEGCDGKNVSVADVDDVDIIRVDESTMPNGPLDASINLDTTPSQTAAAITTTTSIDKEQISNEDEEKREMVGTNQTTLINTRISDDVMPINEPPTRVVSSYMEFNSLSDDDMDSDNATNMKNSDQFNRDQIDVLSHKNNSTMAKLNLDLGLGLSELSSSNIDNDSKGHQAMDPLESHQGIIKTNNLSGSGAAANSPSMEDMSILARNNNNNNNSNNVSNFGDSSPLPTIKTAFIFPRLDEGLSSNPDSAEEDVEEDDDDAMDADVDADEDEYDEDDDEDDDPDDDDDDDDDDDREDDDDDEEDNEDDADEDDDVDDVLVNRRNQAMQPHVPNHHQQSGIDSLFRNQHQQQPKSIGAQLSSSARGNLVDQTGSNLSADSFFNNDDQQQTADHSHHHSGRNAINRQQHPKAAGITTSDYATGSYSLDHHELDATNDISKSIDTAYSNGANNGNYWPMNNQLQQQGGHNSPFNRLGSAANGRAPTTTSSGLGLSQQNGGRQLNTGSLNANARLSSLKSTSNDLSNNNNNNYNRDEAKSVNRFSSDTDTETDRLLGNQRNEQQQQFYKQQSSQNDKSIEASGINLGNPPGDSASNVCGARNNLAPGDNLQITSTNQSKGSNSREVLIEGVLFNVKYLGSTHSDCEGRGEKEDRIHQAEMAVHEVKYRNGDAQAAIEVQLFISTEKIMVLDDKNKKIMMDHSLRTISYIADIGNAIVLIVKKKATSSNTSNSVDNATSTTTTTANNDLHQQSISSGAGRNIVSKVSCHVFESQDSHTITKSISQAFQVAYTELLKANGATDTNNYLPKELDYQDVLNSQEMSTDELEMFARKENQREVIVPKAKGEILGVSIVESGWGSILPTVVIASLKQNGPAERCKKLSIGDQILSVNGISLVGLPLNECQEIIKRSKNQRVARLSVVPCPITVEVKIKRPDTKYQLGFSVQNGVICSLLRGGIAERGGVRVGHRIMSINGTTVVGVPHEKIVTLLASSVGEIRMKTCLTSLYRLILGEDNPVHL